MEGRVIGSWLILKLARMTQVFAHWSVCSVILVFSSLTRYKYASEFPQDCHACRLPGFIWRLLLHSF